MTKKNFSKYTALLSAIMILITALFPIPATAAAKVAVPSKVAITRVASTTSNSVSINWKKSGNVTKYYIYYKQYGTSKWSKIANVSSAKTSYIHKSSKKFPLISGKKYTYTVRGYNSKTGKWGSYNKTGIPVIVKKDTSATYMVHLVNGKGGKKKGGNGYYWDTAITKAEAYGNTMTFYCSFQKWSGQSSKSTFLSYGKHSFRVNSSTKYYFSDIWGREYISQSDALSSINRKNGLMMMLKVKNGVIKELYFGS